MSRIEFLRSAPARCRMRYCQPLGATCENCTRIVHRDAIRPIEPPHQAIDIA